MEIEKLDILFTHKNGFDSDTIDGVCHKKVLKHFSIVQSCEGSYEISLDNKKPQHTGSGGMFIAPPHILQTITHHANKDSGRMKCRWIFFDPVINGAFRPDFMYDFPMLVPEPQRTRINELFDKLFLCDNIFDENALYYLIMKELFSLARLKNRALTASLGNILLFIEENYPKKLTVKELSDAANMSESNFYAIFRKQFGISPIAYLNQYRTTIAAERIRNSNETISSIARSVGFEDSLYFSKMFRKFYQVSPSKYRNM